jgi:hypothetical protein
LEGVGFLVSDPSFVVLIEVLPSSFEVGIQVAWDFSWGKFVGSFQNSSGGKFGIVFHEEFLACLVTRWGSSFSGESGEDVVHDFIFVGTVIARSFSVLPSGLSALSWGVLSLWWRMITFPSVDVDG